MGNDLSHIKASIMRLIYQIEICNHAYISTKIITASSDSFAFVYDFLSENPKSFSNQSISNYWNKKNHRLYNNAMQLLSYIKRYGTFTIRMPILSSSCVLYKTTSALPPSAAIISPFDLPGHTGGPRSFEQRNAEKSLPRTKALPVTQKPYMAMKYLRYQFEM